MFATATPPVAPPVTPPPVVRRKADFVVSSYGSSWGPIFAVSPVTREARQWIYHRMPNHLHVRGTLCVDQRMIGSMLDGIRGDGLTAQAF